jgi:phage baseplate assembly protein V
MRDALRRFAKPLHDKAAMMVARAILRLADDSEDCQMVQVDLLADETSDDVEHLQTYGLTSVPFAGADGLFLSVAGSRSNGVVLAVGDRRYRLTGLQKGEVALYDDQGQKVHLKRDGISIETSMKVTVTAPHVVVISDDVQLGAPGGQAVARVGDTVTCPAGVGHITTGSPKVKSA